MLSHLHKPVSGVTGKTVQACDYSSMIDENGNPRTIELVTVRRKLCRIAKRKAPGYSGNGPDLYAALPDCWVVWAVKLFNIMRTRSVHH